MTRNDNMKKMNKKQRICLLCMIICMIVADILVCFKSPIIMILGYGFFVATIYLAIYLYRNIKNEKEKKLEK